MMAEDLNEMKNDGPDDDFIIKSGFDNETREAVTEESVETETKEPEESIEAKVTADENVEQRLEAAGIEVTQSPETEEVYIPDEDEPDIDESEEELFAQIDAFRQKASMITALIREKQHRMDQLEEQLHEKEVENLRYQQKLLSMKKEVSVRNAAVSREAVAEAAVRAANEAVAKSDDKMTDALKSVEDKMSSMEQTISEGADITGIKGDIFDKIHDENVRVYRNIQDFMKDRDENDERFKNLENSIKKTGAKVSLALAVSIIDLLLVGGVLLTVLGVI